MKHLITFEKFTSPPALIEAENKVVPCPIDDNTINDILTNDWYRSFHTKQDAIDYIRFFADYEFENLPEKILLYRVIKLKDITKFKKNNLGTHFTLDKDLLTDEEFLDSIGISEYSGDLYIITVEVNKDDISLYMTLVQRMLNSNEEEIYIKEGRKPKIISIEKVDE